MFQSGALRNVGGQQVHTLTFGGQIQQSELSAYLRVVEELVKDVRNLCSQSEHLYMYLH